MSAVAFVPSSEDDLRDWLQARGIDTSGYGLGTARPLSSLYDELVTGDSLMTEEDGLPMQLIEGVSLTVNCGDLLLREAKQVFSDGRTVSRGFQEGSASEKLMPGETPEMAAVRGMEEELGREPGEYVLHPMVRTDTVERLSVAFPGLPGRYVLHRFPVTMLPAGFRPEGYVEHQPDKSTHFEWVASGAAREDGEAVVPATEAELAGWLGARGVPTGHWGEGGSKPIGSLLAELGRGESVLAGTGGGGCVRTVAVATVTVTHGCLTLMEDRQEFADGRVRRRGLPGVSEKADAGEDPRVAAIRGMREELGMAEGVDYVLSGLEGTDSSEGESPSFPGLATRYAVHRLSAELTPAGFRPEGYAETQEDKSTFFTWTEGAAPA